MITRQEWSIVLEYLRSHGIELPKKGEVHPDNLPSALLSLARRGDSSYHALSTTSGSEGAQLARKLGTGISQRDVDWISERARRADGR